MRRSKKEKRLLLKERIRIKVARKEKGQQGGHPKKKKYV